VDGFLDAPADALHLADFSKFAAFALGCSDGTRCHLFASACLAVCESEPREWSSV